MDEVPKTCSNCLFWGDVGDHPPYRSCDCPLTGSGNLHLNGMGVHNGEPFGEGSVCTGPWFGCVNFKADTRLEKEVES